jgi:hypothetical protein
MIPSLREIVSSLYGSWRLAHFDGAGMAYFDRSVDGFWRSFFAALLIAPLYAVMLGLRYSAAGEPGDPMHYGLIEAISYLISWFSYPVVMHALTALLDCRDRFVGYMVAYNWSLVLQNGLLVPIAMLNALQVISPNAASVLWLIAIVMVLAYLWFIARAGLAVPPLTAVGIVSIDVLLSLLISGLTDRLH